MTSGEQDLSRPRTLHLERETIQEVTSSLLSSQGHSLWTCDATAVGHPADVKDHVRLPEHR